MRSHFFWSLITVVCGISAPAAFASDFPQRASVPPVPAIVPVFAWTGPYGGIDFGYARCHLKTRGHWTGSGDATAIELPDGLRSSIEATGSRRNSYAGGVHVGYDFQFGSLVAGVVADVTALRLKRSAVVAAEAVDPASGAAVAAAASASQQLYWFGTLRSRVGWTPFERFMIYGTGGLAFGRVGQDVNGIIAASTADGGAEITRLGAFGKTGSGYRLGWVVGGGAEYAVTDNISIQGEYLHVDLNGRNVVTALPAPDTGKAAFGFKNGTTFDIVKAGVNYRF